MYNHNKMLKLSVVTTVYKSEKYLDNYFKNIIGLNDFSNYEIIFITNEPSEIELTILNKYKKKYPDNIRIMQTQLESIAKSINRGFIMADSEYITCADVDDWRSNESFRRQIQTLSNNTISDYTYGDFIIVPAQGIFEGVKISVPKFEKKEATRSSIVGPNHFFRKKLLEKCGFWDEQFKSGGDFDFQIRSAFNTDFIKTEGEPLLYYTRYEGSGSASSNDLQKIERTVIELRYGIYDKINYKYLPEALKYDIFHVYFNGQKGHISEFVPNYDEIMKERFEKYFKKGIRRNYINPEIIEKINLGVKYFIKNPVWTIKKIINKL